MAMSEKDFFLNYVLTRLQIPWPEPLWSEVEEYFNYLDNGRHELDDLIDKTLPTWKELFFGADTRLKPLNKKDRARYDELREIAAKYSENYYYFETEDDGYDDEMIMRCVRSVRDEDFFKLDEKQRQIAIELLELELLELKRDEETLYIDIRPFLRKFSLYELHIDLFDNERRLKYRYLKMKYGRRERLRKEREEEERKRRSRIAACLG